MIIFSSVRFYQKNNQTEFLKKKTETGSNRPILVRFGFLGQKQVQTGLAQFWLDFSGLARFFRFGFGSVCFFAYKTEPNQPVFSKF